jgi:DNA repair protein RadC
VLRVIRDLLASRKECATFTTFLSRMRHRIPAGSTLPLQKDPDSRRMLRRLGVIPSSGGARASEEREIARFLEAARCKGFDPVEASVLVRAFASGVYSVVVEPVCGDVPRCSICPLADFCHERDFPVERPKAYGPGESPSERLAAEGTMALSSEELLALLVTRDGRDTEGEAVAACERLLGSGESLRGLANKRPAELAELEGLPRRGASVIAAAMELARRWAGEKRPIGMAFNHGEDFFNYYRIRLRDLMKEVFVSVLLDQKHRFLADEVCSEGSLVDLLVHPREVFRRAVRESAAVIAFVHNHPSGDPTPSGEDCDITVRLAKAAEILGIPMLDHVIVGDSSYFSFFSEGMVRSGM